MNDLQKLIDSGKYEIIELSWTNPKSSIMPKTNEQREYGALAIELDDEPWYCEYGDSFAEAVEKLVKQIEAANGNG